MERIIFHFNKQYLVDPTIPMWVVKYKGETHYVDHLESTIGFTYEYLKLKLDWLDICKITGLNEYCRSEGYEIKDSEVFNIKESIAQQFNLI